MYHYVRDSDATPFPEIRALPPALFEQQLDWLQQCYRLVSIDELEAAIAGAAPLPDNAALLTFDDGFVDHYATAFPILRRRGVSGVFFMAGLPYEAAPRVLGVHKTHFLLARLGAAEFSAAVRRECELAAAATGRRGGSVFGDDRWDYADERAVKDLLNHQLPIAESDRVLDVLFHQHLGSEAAFARDLYLSEAMVAEMAAGGMAFGYHTRSHRMLSRLSAEEQLSELGDGVTWIRELAGQRRVPFCYPWGGPKTYNADTRRILTECGYSVAFNTVRRRLVPGRDRRFELPRVDTRDLPPYSDDEPTAVDTE
jgi:peptidoglycan/xylan/chitin deacetylase (PgdA/CDA1 family)